MLDGSNVSPFEVEDALAEHPIHCRERIGYKAPEEVVVLDEMPLNPTGEFDRVGLKEMAEDHLHPHGLRWREKISSQVGLHDRDCQPSQL